MELLICQSGNNYHVFTGEYYNMTDKDITDFIVEIERKFPVDRWLIDDVHVWPLVRLTIGNFLLEKYYFHKGNSIRPTKEKNTSRLKQVYKTIKDVCSLYCFDYEHNDKLGYADVLMLTYNVSRNQIIPKSGNWYNVVSEPIEDILKLNGITVKNIEYTHHSFDMKLPRSNDTILISNKLLACKVKHFFKKKILRNYCSFEYKLEKYSILLEYLNKNNVSCEGLSITVLKDTIGLIKELSKYYLSIIKRTGVKWVIVPDWRTENSYALALAANTCNIPVLEIQHGFYGSDSFTHSRWECIPIEGYEIMPTHYWCWTDASATSINNSKNHGYAIEGFPQVELFWHTKENSTIKLYEDIFKKYFPTNKKIILVSLQNIFPENAYPEWLIKIIRDTEEQYFWILRKHISIEESGQDKLCEKLSHFENVECGDGAQLPLILILQHTCVNVTLSSSVVVEAMMEGVPSIVLDDGGAVLYKEQIKDGIVRVVKNPEDFMSTLEEFVTKYSYKVDWDAKMNRISKLIDILQNDGREKGRK